MRKTALWPWLLLLVIFMPGQPAGGQGQVRAVVTSEIANVRVIPAFGGEVRGQVPGGYEINPVTARSSTNDWLRFLYSGNEGWIHVSTLTLLEGQLESLPVADPRTIPYGGFDTPRAGSTDNTNGPTATVRDWLRVRSGPSTGYVVLANVPINTPVTMLGRDASGNWVQINYQGTLGWVATEWLTFPQGFTLDQLPIDGIVANEPPMGDEPEEFIGLLKMMRDRLDLAQPSLDTIRSYWTDAALTGRAACRTYPSPPSDFNIPNQLLAAYYTTLEPLRTEFNDAMFNVRRAIDLFREVCDQPGTQNPVGQARVQGALEIVSLADRQFTDLRRQLDELIPPPVEPGRDECVFSYQGAVAVLPVVGIGEVLNGTFTPEDIAEGYCFDATAGQTLAFESLQTLESNALHLLTVSPLDNPTNFLAVGRSANPEDKLRVGPATIPQDGRYLLVISSLEFPEDAVLQSTFKALVTPFDGGASLERDPVTGEITVPKVIPPLQATPTPAAICPNPSFNCSQLAAQGATCEQAQACSQLNQTLDPDGDGVPCEGVVCPQN